MTTHKRSIATTRPVKRMDTADDTPRIRGYGAVFYRDGDTGTEFKMNGGKIVERLTRAAFDGVDMADVRAMFNHDPSAILGRTSSGTMRVGIDDVGVWYEVDLDMDNPTHRSVLSSIERGDVDGSSFWFTIPRYGEKVTHEAERTIVEIVLISDVIEMGPVTLPAYEATTAAMRDAWSQRDEDPTATAELEADVEIVAAPSPDDETLAWSGILLADCGVTIDDVE